MVYEWDGKRARRNYWTRIAVTGVGILVVVGATAWIADAFGLGF
ncbi:MAG: hypothetical protein ACK4N1_01200 [Pseudorhizobium sp.]